MLSGLHCGGPRFCWSSRDGNPSEVPLEQLGGDDGVQPASRDSAFKNA